MEPFITAPLGPIKTFFCDNCNLFFEINFSNLSSNSYDQNSGKIHYKGIPIIGKKPVVDRLKEMGKSAIVNGIADVYYWLNGNGGLGISCDNISFFKHICSQSLEQRTRLVSEILTSECNRTKKPVMSLIYDPQNKTGEFLRHYYREEQEVKERLNRAIECMQIEKEKFKKHVENPEGSVLELPLFGAATGELKGTPEEVQDCYWKSLKVVISGFNCFGNKATNDPKYSKQQKKIEKLKAEIIEIRRNFYRIFIKNLSRRDVLKEMKKWFLVTFSFDGKKVQEELIKKFSFEEMAELTKKRIQELVGKSPESVIEMEELISKMEVALN